jgi:hypothetical protein
VHQTPASNPAAQPHQPKPFAPIRPLGFKRAGLGIVSGPRISEVLRTEQSAESMEVLRGRPQAGGGLCASW